MKSKKVFKWAMVALLMAAIFYMSSRDATKSAGDSGGVILFIKNTIGIDLAKIFGYETADFIIRKGAHTCEYMLMMILGFNAFREDFKFKKSLLFGYVMTVLYAISDEIHQSFVPGRAMLLQDVMIDTMGATIGLVLICIFSILLKNKNANKNEIQYDNY